MLQKILTWRICHTLFIPHFLYSALNALRQDIYFYIYITYFTFKKNETNSITKNIGTTLKPKRKGAPAGGAFALGFAIL